jgi:hypothetical protein
VGRLKVASFTVHATAEQSVRWKRAAEAEGFASAGAWLAGAADAYLKVRARAGLPVPLSWRRFGRYRVVLMDGREVRLPGRVSPPFGIFRGTAEGAGRPGCGRHTLVYLPSGRIVATLGTERDCKALAAELARVWVRWDGQGGEPSRDAGPILERHQWEL